MPRYAYSSDEFYEIPLEELGLSEVAMEVIKRTGITTVGDCIDHFARGADVLITVSGDFINVMEYEVKPKLEERGYLRIDENRAPEN
jgi:hypothetical protein